MLCRAKTKALLQNTAAQRWLKDAQYRDVVHSCPTAHSAQQILNRIAPVDEGQQKPVRFFYDQSFSVFSIFRSITFTSWINNFNISTALSFVPQ